MAIRPAVKSVAYSWGAPTTRPARLRRIGHLGKVNGRACRNYNDGWRLGFGKTGLGVVANRCSLRILW